MTPDKLLPRRARLALTRSEMMARIRSKDTTPEVKVRAALHAAGLRFRKHASDLPGKPDIANRRNRWVVFVHGCFWHQHKGCRLASTPRSNSQYWGPKLRRNVERNRTHVRQLRRSGYRVLIVWECETRRSQTLDARIRQFLVSQVNALRPFARPVK